MKRRISISIIIVTFVFITMTHFVAFMCGIRMDYRIDLCKSKTEMMPIELATNSQFMAACKIVRNSANQEDVAKQIEAYNAAKICVPILADFLRVHSNGIHFSVISALFGIKDPPRGIYSFLFLKIDGCYIYEITFESLRPFHINSISLGVGII